MPQKDQKNFYPAIDRVMMYGISELGETILLGVQKWREGVTTTDPALGGHIWALKRPLALSGGR